MSLTSANFAWVATLVRTRAAIVLEPGKEYLVESRLAPLSRAAGKTDLDAYVDHVRIRGTEHDKEAIVDSLTTNETSWFRDREPFDVFVMQVLPELLALPNATRTLRIWSAACSSGQEAYTLAMLLKENLPPSWHAEILCTDISKPMLERVQEGRYSQLEIGRGLPSTFMVKYFNKVGTHWQVTDELRRMIRVQHLNLANPFPALPQFDVVFVRNVLIYFDVATKASVLQRIRATTKPGGHLFLGAAETTQGIDDGWERSRLDRYTMIRRPLTSTVPTTRLAALARNG